MMAAVRVALVLMAVINVALTFPECPGAYYAVKEHTGTCHYFPTLNLRFEAARNNCKVDYVKPARLPSIHSEEDNKFFGDNAAGRTWIGLVRDNNKDWRWLDGSNLNYTNWCKDCVSSCKYCEKNTTGKDCATMNDYMNSDKGVWMETDCDGQGRRVMCTSEKHKSWRPINDFEYFAKLSVPKNITWYEAQRECMAYGGDLLSIQNHEEWEQLREWVVESRPDLGERRLWIGMASTGRDSWGWSDGSNTVLKYWRDSYPIDTFIGAKCVYQLTNGMWMNSNCGLKQQGYICKRLKGSAPRTEPPPVKLQGYCPGGYHSMGDRCFKTITSESVTWEEALRRCHAEPGLNPNLISMHSKTETAYLAAHLLEEGREFWIGGTKLVEDRWAWSDCSPAGTYMHLGESKRTGDCLSVGELGTDLGSWSPDNCTVRKGFVCETNKDPNNIIPSPAAQPLPCPDKFTAYGIYCYHRTETMVTWMEAYTTCKNKMASLVTIENEAENNAVFFEVLNINTETGIDSRVWIGYQDLDNDKEYSWIDGNPSNYTRWKRNEPRRKVNGGCAAMREGGLPREGGIWEDMPCIRKYHGVCRRPRAGPTSSSAYRSLITGILTVMSIIVTISTNYFYG